LQGRYRYISSEGTDHFALYDGQVVPIFFNHIDKISKVVAPLTEIFPDLDHVDRLPLHTGNVVRMRSKS
jgi:hypothetical protein